VPRRLTADFVLVGLGHGGVAGFRDVFAIDGAALRPREDRLVALFQTPPASALQQARQVSEDSSSGAHSCVGPSTSRAAERFTHRRRPSRLALVTWTQPPGPTSTIVTVSRSPDGQVIS
jgi:hypothetical protein